VGFEPTISAGERPQTYALDRAATVTGQLTVDSNIFIEIIPLLLCVTQEICENFRRGNV
jgi:hypothetical protein